jgi:predicted AlkP superfamily phosphohydrolase/phosphomutase
VTRRAAVIGLDGAAWHLLEPLLAAGAMPRLDALRRRGAWGTLASTVPAYTPPAWSSAVTGVGPGRHGIYGFHAGNAQAERQELVHSGRLRASALWEMANSQGATTGIYNLPLSYPPLPLEGWMVSGMMTPGYGDRLRGFAFPPEVEAEVLGREPDYVVDVSGNWEQDWRDAALAERMLASLEQRARVLRALLEDRPVDLVFAVLEAPDRLQHVYYRYLDPAEGGYGSPEGRALRPTIVACFTAMDAIVGLLDDYAGAEGGVLVCSDHGFTSWEVSVHTNALLQRWGLLKLKRGARVLQSRAARAAVPVAKRVLPARAARRAKGTTFAAVDWGRTKAFASPIPQQGVFVNVAGRERFGVVPPAEVGPLENEIIRRFEELTGPDGRPVTDVVHRAEDVLGPGAAPGAPDLFPVLRNHRYELDDEVFHRDPFTDLGHLPRGVHHPEGIVLLAAPGARAGARLSGSVVDVAPTLLHMAGLGVPEGLDGEVLAAGFAPGALAENPIQRVAPVVSERREGSSPYSPEEERVIEESLKGLGYL